MKTVDDETVPTELERQGMKKRGAKQYSFFAQIFSGVWIAALTILKGLDVITLDTGDIITTGIAIAAIFSPVYFSIFLDKIRDIRLAK
jgi:undecaprenyl pyrophosphate phosphatase UppP